MGKRTAVTVWLLLALMLAGVCWLGYRGLQRERLRVPLLEAAGRQNAAEVQRLLNAGADPNARDMVLTHRSSWAAFLDSLPYLRRHRRSAPEIGPTALMIACAGKRVTPMPPSNPMQFGPGDDGWKTPGMYPNSAVGPDDPAPVRLLVDHGALVNAKGEAGWSALMSAISTGHAQTVSLLLKHGADVNADWNGTLPLMEVVYLDNHYSQYTYYQHSISPAAFCAMAQALLDSGAKVNAVCNGETPLQAAVLRGDMTLIRLLLNRGADVNALPVPNGLESPALTEAARAGNLMMVKMLLNRGANINAGPQAGFTPLAAAAEGRQEAMLRFLVAQKANVNTPSADGNTAFIWASMKDEPKSVALLLARGANANAVNRAGHTALYFAGSGPVVRMLLWSGASRPMKNIALGQAALRGDAPSVRLLLSEGADPNVRDWQGRTALINALDCDMKVREKTVLAMLGPLLAHGADVNRSDHEGITPLMHGISDVPTLRLLLAHGADVNARAPDGYTALMQAVQNSDLDSARLLLSHGANTNARDRSGSTALMYVAEQNDPTTAALIPLLLAHGADLEARDNQGQTAQMRAAASSPPKAILMAAEKARKKEKF